VAIGLRNPETQARISSWLVIVSGALLLAAILIAMTKGGFSWEDRVFVYQSTGKRLPVVFGTAGISLLLACAGFWFAYASAGERRNPRSSLSWTCFIISAAMITMTCIFLAAYRLMAVVVRPST
jgi:uncharacterized membrane protein YidH (DUF202 family)